MMGRDTARRLLVAGLIALLCLSQTACVVLLPLERVDAAAIHDEIAVGDEVEVYARSGKVYRFEVTQVTATALHGRSGRKRYKIPFAAIETLEVERISFGQALATGGKTLLGVYTVAAVIGAVVLIDSIEESSDD